MSETGATETAEYKFPIDLSPLSDPAAVAARDREWLEKVYARGEAQLTVRAAVTGMVLGGLLSASNLYIGLKIGWSFGMSITSSVIAFAIFGALSAVFPSVKPLSMLENNTAQTAASAAAYMSSAGLISSIPALTMLRREGVINIPELTGLRLTAWLLAISVLGVVVAIPLKRNLINAEQLRFPSGVQCAETIRAMHSTGGDGMKKARALLGTGAFAAVWKFLFECKKWVFKALPETLTLPGTLAGYPVGHWSFALNTSLMLYAAGAIMGLKVTVSLFGASLFNYGFLGPWLLHHDVLRIAPEAVAASPTQWRAFVSACEHDHVIPVRTAEALYGALRSKWSVWPGTAVLVSSSIVAFAFRWRMVARALSGLTKSFTSKSTVSDDPLAEVEVPTSWFGIGLLLCGGAAIYMQRAWFGVPVVEGIVSVLAAFLLSVVAARATGETDVTPIGAMGKITQLLFGALVPGNAAANLMTATVTAGAASHSADLLTEVKTGYLLGGSPRKQFIAQILGVFAGAFVCVPVYFLIADPAKLGQKELAAPAATAWASVAKLLKDGPSNLPRYAVMAIGVGLAIGTVLAILEESVPKHWKRWLPSATGLGIAMVIGFNDSVAMLIGALLTWAITSVNPKWAEQNIISISSGIVAGESIMGILVLILRNVLHWLPE
jgi:OPT family oligopeptide transporter